MWINFNCRMKRSSFTYCLFRLSRSLTVLAAVSLCANGCIKYGPIAQEEFGNTGDGVFIVNEGNFMYGNASLSYYDPGSKGVTNEVYARANAEKLGDVAQSMVIRGDRGYIAVNNSQEIVVIDINTFKLVGSVTGLTSPRYIHFLSDTKAYVTDLYAARITVFDPQTCRITGYIDTEGHNSTEQMVQYGKYVFTNCWSYDNTILVIDSETDRLVDKIEVGLQPTSLALDRYGKLWTLSGGGYEGSPYGWEAPALYRIDAATREIEQVFTFRKGDPAHSVCLNGTEDVLYFINKSVWSMDVTAERVPVRPLIEAPKDKAIFYGLAVDPATSDVYVADAIDYVQPGVVYRFGSDAVPLDTIRAGITPRAFCFK